jgi:SAM-dependent methyltransferase
MATPRRANAMVRCRTIMSVRERMSFDNETFYSSYGNHLQRYTFAEPYCSGKKVLDAGCGIGYGSAHLATNAALSVVAVDISDEAVAPDLGAPFDVVVNFENIEHLTNPTRLLAGVKAVLVSDGIFVVSTPNGQLTERDEAGNIKNQFHVKEFTEDEFREMLGQFFSSVELFGQWKTPERLARQHIEKQLFINLCDLYYSPYARMWRGIRRLLGKTYAPPPLYSGEWDAFAREFTIKPIKSPPFPWPPDVIMAVCRL